MTLIYSRPRQSMAPLPSRRASARLDPALAERMRALQEKTGRLLASNYDISARCNLSCEGCLYFDGAHAGETAEAKDLAAWEMLFTAEAARGVTVAYLAGGEPSLEIERLRVAQRHIPRGVIFTNGTKRLPDDIRYRIHISIWGLGDRAERLRGADVVSKALRNYRDDPRAVLVFTITAQNMEDIEPATLLAAEHGLPITFSYFSPTLNYRDRLQSNAANDDAYFRSSSTDDNLLLSNEDYGTARAIIARLITDHPATVRYSLDYNDWITQPEIFADVDATGLARDCVVYGNERHWHWNSDLSQNREKCSSPNLECSNCRAYAMGYSNYLGRYRDHARTEEGLHAWLNVRELWVDLFLG